MASTCEGGIELEEILPNAIPDQNDAKQNSEKGLSTTESKPGPSKPEPEEKKTSTTDSDDTDDSLRQAIKIRAFYTKTFINGRIRFMAGYDRIGRSSFFNHDAGFIKITADAVDKEMIVQQVAEGVVNELWQLRHKNLLLSLTEAADEFDYEGRKAFKKGLRNMLPGTCLVTCGTNDGVTQVAGNVVRNFNLYQTRHPKGLCPAIGITRWDSLRNKVLLKSWELSRGVFGIDSNGQLFTLDIDRKRWTLNPASLTEVNFPSGGRVSIGDFVQVDSDPEEKFMTRIFGKIGVIKAVDVENKVQITVHGVTWWFKRKFVRFLTNDCFIGALKTHFKTYEPSDKNDKLVQAVMRGNVKAVNAIIRKAYEDFNVDVRRLDLISEYDILTDVDDLQNKANTKCCLHPGHHFFVFVEDSTLNEFGGQVEFRAKLEKQIASEMTKSRMNEEPKQNRSVDQDQVFYLPLNGDRTSDTVACVIKKEEQVPIVNLVLNGDRLLLTVICARNKGIRSVVVKGSTGAFETTSQHDTLKRQDNHSSDIKNDKKTGLLRQRNMQNDSFTSFQHTVQKQPHMMSDIYVCDMPDMLVEKILAICWKAGLDEACLLRWALGNHDRAVALKQLVAMDITRMSIVPLHYAMYYCIVCNDNKVLETLFQRRDIDTDIDVWTYWNLCRKVDTDGLLKSLHEKLRASIGKKDLNTVIQVIKQMKGRPVVGRRSGFSFTSWWKRPANNLPVEQLDTDNDYPYVLRMCPYWEYMCLWTLLLRKHDMAKKLLTKTEHPICMALIAQEFCKEVKQQTDDRVLISEMKKNMSEWSAVAKEILDECYQNQEYAAYATLSMVIPFWNMKSCLDLAIESRNMEFLAQQACRNLVSDVWNGCDLHSTCILLEGRNVIYFDKIRSPKMKFVYNLISYLVFLGLFTYVLLFDFTQTVSTIEFVLMAWVLTLLLEEIRQMYTTTRNHSLKSYFSEGWNVIDIFTIVLFLIGFGLRFKDFRTTFDWPRVVLTVDFVAFFFRLVHIFSIQKTLGPKLIIILRMVHDLLYFLVIMAVFLFAYAIASHSILYPNAPVSWETARKIISKPYWHLFGELFLDETEGLTECSNDANVLTNGTMPRCPSETGKIVAPIMMGVYLLFSNILLLNLLIAMFSYTFTKIHEQSDKVWCFQRYFMVKEYAQRNVLGPPLNVVSLIYERVCNRTERFWKIDSFHLHYTNSSSRTVIQLMREACERTIKAANEKRDHSKEKGEKEEEFRHEALKRFEALTKKIDDLEKKAKHDEEFQNTMLIQIKQAAEEEDEFRRLMLNEFRQMKASIAALKK